MPKQIGWFIPLIPLNKNIADYRQCAKNEEMAKKKMKTAKSQAVTVNEPLLYTNPIV
jgi:hypothetical protein